MKTLNRSFFWVILITLAAAFTACDLNPNVDPDPEQTVVRDSVAIEATVEAPVGTHFSELALVLRSSAIPDGVTCQINRNDVRIFRFVYYDEVARAMIGTQCELVPSCLGEVNGKAYSFFSINPGAITVTVQKVTKVMINAE